MTLFDCTPEKLAKLFSGDPRLYNSVKHFLAATRRRNVLSPEINGSIDEIVGFVEKANSIACDSDYFIFDTYDSWCNRMGHLSEGYAVFQKVDDEMIVCLGVNQSVPQFEDVVDALKRRILVKYLHLLLCWMVIVG
jgi:hypothetical protein